MTIGPFWCPELDSWLRFITESDEVRVQISTRNPEENKLCRAWEDLPDKKGTWLLYFSHGPNDNSEAAYCLYENTLYYTEGETNRLTGNLELSRWAAQVWEPVNYNRLLKSIKNPQDVPFASYKKSEHADNPLVFSSLPILPEEISAFKQDILKKARQHARNNVESPLFNEAQLDFLYSQFSDELDEFSFDSFETSLDYLRALKEIISNREHSVHQKLNARAAATDFDREIFVATADHNTQEFIRTYNSDEQRRRRLYAEKKEYFFNLLIEEGKYLARELGIDIDFSSVLAVEEERRAEHVLVPFNRDAGIDYPPNSDLIEVGEFQFEELDRYADEQLMEDIELIDLRTAVANAQENYEKWYKKDNSCRNDRGPNGFFSWFRHGKTGQQFAAAFKNEVNTADKISAIASINEFLLAPKTAYHRHSFASFLLDELTKLKEFPWKSLKADATINRYSKAEVVELLNSGLSFHI
ncbi:hypothetical protein [Legionella jordanis]|uniref:Uncharacterized protein n=1 Tax=Legionella jordanis TaxID=456 RepID=A0A0W0VBX3_9GAMM|nr:hypothetical protein [Legionella jordanis]KTD17592.1 hypothetical protein Ljor_1898 [Legionella jordanis]RMX00875.1 hypothetical protein EAW55_11910 [Legionella jordanis]VEH11486.1 Uncharacterised protein [Legionella jordanis]HAT8714896.1 hypothetical protein [Legionella jordanis]